MSRPGQSQTVWLARRDGSDTTASPEESLCCHRAQSANFRQSGRETRRVRDPMPLTRFPLEATGRVARCFAAVLPVPNRIFFCPVL
jgi:hypothetical protein